MLSICEFRFPVRLSAAAASGNNYFSYSPRLSTGRWLSVFWETGNETTVNNSPFGFIGEICKCVHCRLLGVTIYENYTSMSGAREIFLISTFQFELIFPLSLCQLEIC